MDIISHGLWGSGVFGRKDRKSFWLTFFFGVAPDLFSFGILFVANLLGILERPDFSHGTPSPASVPQFVHVLYNYTHSLVIFLAVFLLVWFIRKKPFWLMGAWALHILIDIPSHSSAFFPTPFLWPVSNFHVNGISWGNPVVYVPNLILLAILYLWFFIAKRKKR
ncbi:MAG: hypothetical protein WC238_01580 [Parcubacteria group bacterium]|jgi:hypothetical protein